MVFRVVSLLPVNRILSAAAMALGLVGVAGLAHAGTYSSLATFQAASQGSLFFQAFGGPPNFNIPPTTVSGNGYTYTVNVTPGNAPLARTGHGLGPTSSADAGIITFSGKPVTAFAGTFVVEDGGTTGVAGSITVSTDTGESYTFSVPATVYRPALRRR